MEITSTSNSKFKLLKSLHQKKARVKHGLFLTEGIKSVHDAQAAGMEVAMIAVADDYEGKLPKMEEDNILIMPHTLFEQICGTVTPQGILAAVKMPSVDIEMDLSKVYLYCDHVSDPGNLGTIIRTADAVGAGAVLLSEECADVYAPKTVRATMGSIFHIPVLEAVGKEDLENYRNNGFQIVSGMLCDESVSYTQCDMTRPTIFVVGNEANGVSQEILKCTDCFVKIPIIGGAESLNVAVAAAVLLYEALRQRKNRLST